jgi:nuclear cap-binding protein subunit 1
VASFLELLQSFLVVLDEPGVSYERMEAAALCVGEGIIRVRAGCLCRSIILKTLLLLLFQAGSQLFDYDSSAVEAMVSTIRSCLALSEFQQPLTPPITLLHSKEVVGASEASIPEYKYGTVSTTQCDNFTMKLLASLVQVLDDQLAASFRGSVECLPQVHGVFLLSDSMTPFEIPSTMVPPEDFDFGGLAEDSTSRRIMMPRLSLRFFDSEVCWRCIIVSPESP